MPCVIYLHGNSSSRIEALDLVQFVLPANMTLFCFDFAGCGMSEGEYISLGWYERDDVQLVVDYLRSNRNVNSIGLWGRSMGAVTALLHGDRDPCIAGMILDSPFSSLKKLTIELAKSYKVPGFLASTAMKFIRSTIQKKVDFDIENLIPIDHVQKCFIPALFAAAKQDDFINPQHSIELFEAYQGEKSYQDFDGDHNSTRPISFFE